MEKLSVRRPLHRLDGSNLAIIREGYSCMRGPPELVLHIRCTGGDIFGWRTTVWFTGIRVILGGLGRKKRISSAHYPQSNGRTELAVKTAKRTLIDDTDGYGRLRHDLAARAMMTHRNTPHQDLGLSPAEMLYDRVIRDHLPILREKYQIHKSWREIRVERKRHGKETPAESKALHHTQPPTLRTSGWRIGASAEPRGTTLTAVDENREGFRDNGKRAIPGTSRRKQQSRCITGDFSGKSFRWWTHRTIRPKKHNHSLKGRCQSIVKLHA